MNAECSHLFTFLGWWLLVERHSGCQLRRTNKIRFSLCQCWLGQPKIWILQSLGSGSLRLRPDKIEHGTPLTTEELQSRLYIPTREEWNGIGRDSESVRVAKALESILECANGVPMLVHYPRLSDVDYPIDLTMMKDRVKNHFYRRISALMSDALQMYEKIP